MKGQPLDTNAQFLQAYDDFADAIFRHCYYRVSDRERARDIMQETFTRTWEYIATRNGQIENIRAFLYRIANNLIIDEYRKKKTNSLDELLDKGFDPGHDEETDIHTAIAAREIIALFDKLDISYRKVLIMRYIDDIAPKEIADILGESENAISVRLHRGIKKIKELMERPRKI